MHIAAPHPLVAQGLRRRWHAFAQQWCFSRCLQVSRFNPLFRTSVSPANKSVLLHSLGVMYSAMRLAHYRTAHTWQLRLASTQVRRHCSPPPA
jgi:hypothetical protein